MLKLHKRFASVLCGIFTAAVFLSARSSVHADEMAEGFPKSFDFHNMIRATDSEESLEFCAFCGAAPGGNSAYVISFNVPGLLSLDNYSVFDDSMICLPSDVYFDGNCITDPVAAYQIYQSRLIEDTLGFLSVYYTEDFGKKYYSQLGDTKMASLSSVSEGDKVYMAAFDNPNEIVSDYGYVDSVQKSDNTFIVRTNEVWVQNNNITWVGAPIINRYGEIIGVLTPLDQGDPNLAMVYALDDVIDYLDEFGLLTYGEETDSSDSGGNVTEKNDNNDTGKNNNNKDSSDNGTHKNNNKDSSENDNKKYEKDVEDESMSTKYVFFGVIILLIVGAAVAGFFILRKKKNSTPVPPPQNYGQPYAEQPVQPPANQPPNYGQQMPVNQPQNYGQQMPVNQPQDYGRQMPANQPQDYGQQQINQPVPPAPPESPQSYQMFNSQDSLDINQVPVTTFIQTNLTLKCIGGTLNGSSYPITDTLCIGRNAALCNIIYPVGEPGVSGMHCKVTPANGQAQITDVGSSAGTFINGVQILPNVPYPMPAGSSFYIGSPENTFVITE